MKPVGADHITPPSDELLAETCDICPMSPPATRTALPEALAASRGSNTPADKAETPPRSQIDGAGGTLCVPVTPPSVLCAVTAPGLVAALSCSQAATRPSRVTANVGSISNTC